MPLGYCPRLMLKANTMNKPDGSAMSYDELRGAIAQRHRALSGRLQQIAEFVLDHPTDARHRRQALAIGLDLAAE